jgi:hypothetical protein
MTTLGTLSIHLDGGPCRVGCKWCYLGARQGPPGRLRLPVVEEALGALQYQEVAVAVSEPLDAALEEVRRIVAAARAPVTVTTTPQLARRAAAGRVLLDGVRRVNLSIDSVKGVVEPARVAAVVAEVKAVWPQIEVVLVVTLDSEELAERLVGGGLLGELVGVAGVGKVALNALKPPPAWCDRKWWLGALGKLRGLLERELERRLFLDCYVAARILGLGECPGRADLAAAGAGAGDGERLAFRGCVYQRDAEVVGGAREIAEYVRGWRVPGECPFEIR